MAGRYVALGSSMAAGPGISPRAPGSPRAAMRSARNYPHLLAERFKATQRVGVLKAKNDFPPADPEREKTQIQRLRALAEAAQLDPEFAEKFLTFIISEVIRHHEAISEDHQRADAS